MIYQTIVATILILNFGITVKLCAETYDKLPYRDRPFDKCSNLQLQVSDTPSSFHLLNKLAYGKASANKPYYFEAIIVGSSVSSDGLFNKIITNLPKNLVVRKTSSGGGFVYPALSVVFKVRSQAEAETVLNFIEGTRHTSAGRDTFLFSDNVSVRSIDMITSQER